MQKILKKNCRKEVRKNVFLYSHEYRDQKMGLWWKNAKNNFSRNTRIVRAKNVGKKVGKKCEKRFLYSYEYPEQKMVGKRTREIIFPETH